MVPNLYSEVTELNPIKHKFKGKSDVDYVDRGKKNLVDQMLWRLIILIIMPLGLPTTLLHAIFMFQLQLVVKVNIFHQ